MRSRIYFVLLCLLAIQLHGAEQRELECRPYGDIKKTYEEWTETMHTVVWPETTQQNGKGQIIPGKYRGWTRVREADGRVEVFSSEQAKALFIKFEKEDDARLQVHRLKAGACIIGGLALMYASYACAPTDYWKNLGSCAFKLITGN